MIFIVKGSDLTSLKELAVEFIGKGEVKGFLFLQLKRSNTAYLFEVSDTSGNKWYEVFKRKVDSRFCKISYPKSKAFGITAWTFRNYTKALGTFRDISV